VYAQWGEHVEVLALAGPGAAVVRRAWLRVVRDEARRTLSVTDAGEMRKVVCVCLHAHYCSEWACGWCLTVHACLHL
jgi:hypothetical protein